MVRVAHLHTLYRQVLREVWPQCSPPLKCEHCRKASGQKTRTGWGIVSLFYVDYDDMLVLFYPIWIPIPLIIRTYFHHHSFTVQWNKAKALVNLTKTPSCPAEMRKASAGTMKIFFSLFFCTFTLQAKDLLILLSRQPHTKAGTKIRYWYLWCLVDKCTNYCHIFVTLCWALECYLSFFFFFVYCFSRSDYCFEHGSVLATCLLTCIWKEK